MIDRAPPVDRRSLAVAPVAVLAALAVAVAVVAAAEVATVEAWVGVVTIAAWASVAIVATRRRPTVPLNVLVVGLVASATAIMVATARSPTDGPVGDVRSVAIGLLLASGGLLVVGAPDGRFDRSYRRAGGAAVSAVAALLVGVLIAGRPSTGPALGTASVVVGAVAATVLMRTCQEAASVDRARVQWFGWGGAVGLTLAGLTTMVHLLIGWPTHPGAVILVATLALAIGVGASTFDSLLAVVDRVLVHTIVALGLVVFVVAVYLVVVLGLHGVPDDGEGAVLALSLLAAAVVAVAALPLRQRLLRSAEQRVYGDGDAPDRTLETFATRMSRAVPMDELLLQLVESLRRTMKLTSAEVWTGTDGTFERAAAVPSGPPARLLLDGEPLAVASRAHVQGNAWISVWIPALLEGRDSSVRFTSVAHLGELLGFIVTERPETDVALDEDEERRVLVDLARQLGLALHNVRLDTALQASLDEVRATNRELVASRSRIVAATDESRRRIERNLHDGAQQHLVALAVKVGLVGKLIDADPAMARAMLDELRDDVQATLGELRELAHGIYPPLLRDRGLPEALRTAAQRSTLPVTVDAVELGRYGAELETAVYFCCLEAIQNAVKHAGDDATISVVVREREGALHFEVADDGAGFTLGDNSGHGFVNMRDRLGAFDGSLQVDSVPGGGTTVRGVVPLM